MGKNIPQQTTLMVVTEIVTDVLIGFFWSIFSTLPFTQGDFGIAIGFENIFRKNRSH